MGVIICTTTIDASIEDVFAFHLDTRNAARIAPRGSTVLEVDGEFPVVVGARVRLVVRQRPLPWSQRWLVEIEEVDPLVSIVDRMIDGPFARWRHARRFVAVAGGVEMAERLEYALPLGVVGRLVDALLVRRMIRRTFEERQRRTRALLAGP